MDDKAAFQAKLYEKIEPKIAKVIMAVTHHPNRSMHDISTLANRIPFIFLRRNEVNKDIMMFEAICGGYECLFSSSVNLLYTPHTDRFLTVWRLILLFGL